MAFFKPASFRRRALWFTSSPLPTVRMYVCVRRRSADTDRIVTFKDIPALPTSQVYRKIQNACKTSENRENFRFWQVFTQTVLRILFSPQ